MIDWKTFYANGGYYGDNDPYCYDDGYYEEFDEEDSEEEKEEDFFILWKQWIKKPTRLKRTA